MSDQKTQTTPVIRHPDPRYMHDGFCRNVVGVPAALECCGSETEPGHVYCKNCEQINFVKSKPRHDKANNLQEMRILFLFREKLPRS